MTTERSRIIIDDLEILDLTRKLKNIKSRFWIWQKASPQNPRRIHLASINFIFTDKNTMELRPLAKAKFKFVQPKDLYIFASEGLMGFRVDTREHADDFLIVTLPKKINLLTAKEFENLKVIDDDQEEKFKHLRGAPRKAASANQMAEIMKASGPHRGEKGFYQVHDISTGGIGLISFDPGEFAVGEDIDIISINGNPPAKRLSGAVVAIRKMEGEIDLFKVGIKFS